MVSLCTFAHLPSSFAYEKGGGGVSEGPVLDPRVAGDQGLDMVFCAIFMVMSTKSCRVDMSQHGVSSARVFVQNLILFCLELLE